MRRTFVESSTLRSVGYDRDQKILQLEFVTGTIYNYQDVPPEVYRELLDAPSLGKYFNFSIKDFYEFYQLT